MKLIIFKREIKSGAVRTRSDIINLLLNACELIIDSKFDIKNEIVADAKSLVYVDKMSRLFLITENKYTSFSFPFNIDLDLSKLSFCSYEIDHATIAILSSIMSNYTENMRIEEILSCVWDNSDLQNVPDEYNERISVLMTMLLSFDTGYVRFDIDPENAIKYAEKGKPLAHPEFHLDINYSGNSTYKLGLNSKITMGNFIDILDITKNCWFLKKPI